MIIYLHGFNSSPDSKKATLLRNCMEQRGLGARYACPALAHAPELAIETAELELRRHPVETACFVGSSLGGFYATFLCETHGAKAVLINPAVYPHRDLRAYLGTQQNLYTGERYEITEAHLAKWEAMYTPKVSPERYLLLVETGDELLDYREAVERYRGARQVVVAGGDHTFASFSRHIDLILDFAGMTPG